MGRDIGLLSACAALLWLVAWLVSPASFAQDRLLGEPVGGPGGLSCPPGERVVGLESTTLQRMVRLRLRCAAPQGEEHEGQVAGIRGLELSQREDCPERAPLVGIAADVPRHLMAVHPICSHEQPPSDELEHRCKRGHHVTGVRLRMQHDEIRAIGVLCH